MSAFERLQNYSSRRVVAPTSSVFDVTTPEGAFLAAVHKQGLAMYKNTYRLKPEFLPECPDLLPEERQRYDKENSITPEQFMVLSDEDKTHYDQHIDYTELYNVITTPGNQVVNAVAGSGKALPSFTSVVTPRGYVPMKEIKVGDLVAGTDGKFHRVLGVFPQGRKRVYLVRFSDGSVIPCSPDHLWTVTKDGKEVTCTTEELKDCDSKLSVKSCKPVDFRLSGLGARARELPTFKGIDPFLLGRFIAYMVHCDGVPEDKLEEFTDEYLGDVSDKDFDALCNCTGEYSRDETFLAIRFSPVSFRRKFLIGYLSTEAHCSDDSVTFSETDRGAVDMLRFVAESLGHVVAVYPIGNLGYCVVIKTGVSLISNSADTEYKRLERDIVEVIDSNSNAEMICIQVSASDKLYLTEHFIPTHNTTALVLKVLHDIVTGEAMTFKSIPNGESVRVVNKMWVCTFLRSGAEELGQALADWQAKLGYTRTASQVQFSTMDAEFSRCVKAMGVTVTIGETFSLFKKAVDQCNITRKGYPLTKEDYNILQGIFVYCRGRLDDKRYQHPSAGDYDLTKSVIDMVLHYFTLLKQQAGVMDFEDVMELLYKYLYVEPNPAVQDFVANRFNFIYVDEFQDTSQMAYAILKFYARGRLWMNCSGATEGEPGLYTGRETLGKFVVVGDPSQCFVKGTPVLMADGSEMPIDKVDVGDYVKVALGQNIVGSARVEYVSMERKRSSMVTIVTDTGHRIRGTADHRIPVRDNYCMIYGTPIIGERQGMGSVAEQGGSRFMPLFQLDEEYGSKVTHSMYIHKEVLKPLADIRVRDMVVVKDDISIHYEAVRETQIEMDVEETVYDISVTGVHNFFADRILVHNCIYSFRGSDSKILTELVDTDFRPTLSTLSVNWRCPSEILEPVVPSIHINKDSASQDIRAARAGGEFSAFSFASIQSMLDRLKVDLNTDMEENLNCAVLCRTNFDGLLPAFILEDSGKFNFSISGENMTMDSPLPKKLIGAASLFTEKSSKGVRATLEMLCGRRKWEVASLMDAVKASNKSVWAIPMDDLSYSAPSIFQVIAELKKIIFVNGERDRTQDIKGLMYLYSHMVANVFEGDSAYCESARSYLAVLMYMISTHNFKSIYEFTDEISFINDKLHSRVKKANAPIQIATVHEFKGKERDSIIIWNDSQNVFPSSKCDENDEELLAEERRVHYIACTRARKRERIYTRSGLVGRFVNEMGVSPQVVMPGVKLSK